MVTVPTLHLLRYRYPVNDYIRGVRQETAPDIPAPSPTPLVVWRKNWRVWRLALSEAQFVILSALRDGARLGAALEQAATRDDVDEESLGAVGEWFREWTGEGMFARVELP